MKYLATREEPRNWRMRYVNGSKTFERERVEQDPFDDADEIEADDAGDAAETYVDERFADWSYPGGPVTVWVRDEDGVVVEVEVSVDFTPVFHGWAQRLGPKYCEHKYVYMGRCSSCERPMPESTEASS